MATTFRSTVLFTASLAIAPGTWVISGQNTTGPQYETVRSGTRKVSYSRKAVVTATALDVCVPHSTRLKLAMCLPLWKP
jgi:hypothetical protein